MGKGLKISDAAFLKNSGVTPASFPGLFRWYKADSFLGIANDGDSIGGGANVRGPWIDQTGSGDDATAVAGPLYRTNIVGSMPVIRFAPANPFMNFAPGTLNDFTVVAACRSPAAVDSFIFYNLGTGHQLRRSFFATNHLLFFNGVTVNSANFSSNNFLVAGCKRSGAAIDFRENLTSRGAAVAAGGWAPNQIGYSAGQEIDMGELLIYNQTLSEADLDSLYNDYLKPKWVTLP